MFSFIKTTDLMKNTTNSVLDGYEKEWNIVFPSILRTYYLYYNFSEIKNNKGRFPKVIGRFPVSLILPLEDNDTWSVKEYREYIEKGEYVYSVNMQEYVPFAVYEDFVCYFWEKKTGEVYMYGSTMDSELVKIFDSVEDFFLALNEGVKKAERKRFKFF